LVRTVDYVTPTVSGTGLTPGAAVVIDFQLQYTPFNVSTTTGGVVTGAIAGAALPIYAQTGYNNFITTPATVRRYRPVAACIRWVPSGPYNNRQGVVAMGYSPGTLVANNGTAVGMTQWQTAQLDVAPNGSKIHEIRWVPTAVDENFTDVAASNSSAAGSMTLSLNRVDGTASSSTLATANGQLMVFTVWEWIPAASTLNLPPKAPLPYTSQQVLATISDMGAFLLDGALSRAGMSAVGTQAVTGLVTYGVQTLYRRANHMMTTA